jgi:multicomponent Na+:H+ antiporter subunit G
MRTAGDIIIAIGIVFVFIGVCGIHRFKNFYTRLLVTAKIDALGAVTILIGIAVRHGFSAFSFKVLLLMVILMIVNPLASHMIGRSAYLSGYQTESQQEAGAENYNEDHL